MGLAAALLGGAAACASSGGGGGGAAAAGTAALPTDPAALHRVLPVMDLHVDTMLLVRFIGYPFAARNAPPSGFEPWKGHTDLPRMREGGVDVAWFPIVGNGFCEGQACVEEGLAFADLILGEIAAHPDDMALATTPADVERIVAGGRIASILAMEGMHPIGPDPAILDAYYAKGVRYIGLAHFNRNPYAMASQARADGLPNGLTDLGRDLIGRMNELGIVLDVAHGHPDSVADALAVSRAPVICSHTGVRGVFDVERNLSDDQIRAIAATGGVVAVMTATLWTGPDILANTLDDVLDHVDHVVEVAGIDHVAFGSDFDGFIWTPADLRDVTELPEITRRLIEERGYSPEDVRKFWGGNMMRVWLEVERVAGEMSGG